MADAEPMNGEYTSQTAAALRAYALALLWTFVTSGAG
jgi:hypothetical protein